ncbi:MAG: hypothetical protein ACXW30_01375 [Micavibrio sp.]
MKTKTNPNITADQVIEIWKASVELTAHFNEICLKVRALAISLLSAVVAASAYYFTKGGNETLNFSSKEAIIFSVLSSMIWLGFFMMDRLWYHKLLRGCVKFTEDIERKYEQEIPELSLAQAITKESRSLGPIKDTPARNRLNFFYILGFMILTSPVFNLLAVRNASLLFNILYLIFFVVGAYTFFRHYKKHNLPRLKFFLSVILFPFVSAVIVACIIVFLKEVF